MWIFVYALTQWQPMFPLFSLVALSIVEIQPVNIDGKVGKSVKFKCSGWNVWKNVEEEDKFFCNSQCSDVIVTAAFGKTERKDRIEITNRKDGLHSLTGPDGAQQSLHPLMADEDQFYSTLQPINRNAVLESMSVDTRSGS
ncbi:hypothetical protein GBF38_003215 [Nibea albiflora]|uniref:Uncharacterized protein n=1 Tax=Nibea albiflora TaxID=240163 RepID=A0ACB7FJE0_NIBAL|nr:hypothetical protein GBF38_003215 [Nibea albiflora]